MFECSLTYCVLWVLCNIVWWLEWYNNVYFWNIYYEKDKTFFRGSVSIENLYVIFFRSDVTEHCDVSEHVVVWFSVQLRCANVGGFVWNVLHLCPLRIQLRYWLKYYGSSMKFSGSLWWTVMRPESIVGDVKLWLRSGWVFLVLLQLSCCHLCIQLIILLQNYYLLCFVLLYQ